MSRPVCNLQDVGEQLIIALILAEQVWPSDQRRIPTLCLVNDRFELVPMATPTWVNELGAKGVGESGTIGSIPSVYNAVIDAVSHLGVRHLEMPCTPEKVWAAVRAAQRA